MNTTKTTHTTPQAVDVETGVCANTQLYEKPVQATETWQFFALFIGIFFPIVWLIAALAPAREATSQRFRRYNRWLLILALIEIIATVALIVTAMAAAHMNDKFHADKFSGQTLVYKE